MISNQEPRKYKRKKSLISGHAKMMSVKRVAEKYGFSIHTVYNWVHRDGLKYVKHGPGGKIIIKQYDVEAFIKKWYEEEE